ncbi:MAG: bi-domain-containing oxidoreductase, partial [Gemmatimonadales bacterium]
LQDLGSGALIRQEVPRPTAPPRHLLVEARASLISAGTERMLVEFAKASLVAKARSQPERVKQVLEKMATDGIGPTLEAVRAKLNEPIPLGYCHAGVVQEVGRHTAGFVVGDRVVSNGPHAELVRVPQTLAARIPEGVSDEAAAFAPLAAIGLQGIRLAHPTLGETVVVFGLGLIGLLTVQLLEANGCRVVGIDRDPERIALAKLFGASVVDASSMDTVAAVMEMTSGVGADAVILTLATDQDEPIRQAAQMSRQRGRLVLVGVTGLDLVREDFYRKELQFSVSCSYGPGRYDARYEEEASDYPIGFVRWTAQRNFEAVLQLMASGRIDPIRLITHRFDFDKAEEAYTVVTGGEKSLAVMLTYPGIDASRSSDAVIRPAAVAAPGQPVIGIIGAGNFARRTLLPVIRKTGARIKVIGSGQVVAASRAGEQFGAEVSAGKSDAALNDADVDTVFVLTRHDAHAKTTIAALNAGKHVFVEKPLALTEEELDLVADALRTAKTILTVGFNRRFAPMAVELRSAVANRSGPLSVMCTVNAGAMPADHWTRDSAQGGGRIVGEGCHFIDLLRYLVGAPIRDLSVGVAHDSVGLPVSDVAHITLTFADGSVGTIAYVSNGSKAFPKEQVTVFADGRTLQLENWRRLRRFGGGRSPILPQRQAKGHQEEVAAFLAAVRAGGPPPIPYDELFEVSRWAIRAEAMARGAV